MTNGTYLKNVKTNYVFVFFKSLNVTSGIWMLYLASTGLSLVEIGLLEGIFHVTSFVMETPTGAIADIFGRKFSRILSVLFSILSGVLMIFASSFFGFAIAFIITALSYNLESGSGEALIYDSLKASNKEKAYMKVVGNIEVIFQITTVIALIIGGYLGDIEYVYVYVMAIIISIIALLISLFFKEPLLEEEKKDKMSFNVAMKKQYVDSFKVVKEQPKLSYLISYSALLASSCTVTFFYIQIALERLGYSKLLIGAFLAVGSLFASFGALKAKKIDEVYGERNVLKIIPFIFGVTLLSFIKIEWAIIGFSIMSFVEAILFVASRDYINKLIPSDQRATVLSFDSMIFSLMMIITFPVFGYLSDQIGMNYAFFGYGVIVLVFSILNYRLLRKIKKTNL